MSLLETIDRVRAFLERNGRVSLRVLRREFELDDNALNELVEEFVDVQQVAAREGEVLSWIGSTWAEASTPEPETSLAPEASSEPASAGQPATAERRHLTVMFVDLVDSTELSRRLDAEDLRDVVRGYQECAAGAIEHLDGHVAQYLGDGLLVYFSYPRAHEDDAERAVRAGLAIVDNVAEGNGALVSKYGIELAVRVGIHTGPVVIGEMGGGATRETLAMGDTANLAARIEGQAETGTVALSSATLRLVSGIFVTEALGARVLKGAGEVQLHRALRPSGMRSRLDVAAATGLTPLVARDQELGLLQDRFAQVGEGLGQAVLISGEAGIGKSRLVQAFRDRVAEDAHTWLECRCSPYAQDSALFPVLELQRQVFGLSAETPGEVRLERLEGALDRAGFDLADVLPLMANFHGLPPPERYPESVLSPEGRLKKTFEFLAEWFLRLGRLQPLVLLMEDLHWMDPSTQQLLGQILERIPREQVLLLATYRPDFESSWGAKSHLTPMLLARLTRPQLGDLVRKAARGRDLSEEWIEEIVRRSDGVPLFAEELTKAVLESSAAGAVSELQIPESLQDSLMARLDALGPVKELAQLGAVLGREFSYDLLLEVSPMKEAALQRALAVAVGEELFYQRGTPPEATYLFKHALIRDAAYESLLRKTRQRHHQRVAETLIERMGEVVEEQPELVAHHLTEAKDVERCLDYWQRAAERANTRATYEEALVHARRGLRALESAPGVERATDHELGLLMALATALVAARGYSSPETKQTWERALTVCDPATNPVLAAVVNYQLGNTLGSAGDPRSALDHYTETLRIGEAASDELLMIAGHYGRSTALYLTGRIDESCEHIEQAISLFDPEIHRFDQPGYTEDPGIGSWCEAGWHLWLGGAPDRAAEASRRGIALARESQQAYNLAFAMAWGAVTTSFRRDLGPARELAGEAAAFSDDQGFPMLAGVSRIVEAWAAGLEGQDPTAIDRLIAAMGEASATGQQGGAPQMLCLLAELQLKYHRPAEAIASLDGALAIGAQSGESYFDAELHRLKGEAFLAERGEEEGEQEFESALGVARGQQARSFELRAATSLARLCQRQGKKAQARDLLGPIYDWFTEGFDTQDLKDAKALLEQLA